MRPGEALRRFSPPGSAWHKKAALSAGLRKTVKPTYGYDHRSVFTLCTVAAAPWAPLCKGRRWCCTKSQIAQYTERCIEVRSLSVRQIKVYQSLGLEDFQATTARIPQTTATPIQIALTMLLKSKKPLPVTVIAQKIAKMATRAKTMLTTLRIVFFFIQSYFFRQIPVYQSV